MQQDLNVWREGPAAASRSRPRSSAAARPRGRRASIHRMIRSGRRPGSPAGPAGEAGGAPGRGPRACMCVGVRRVRAILRSDPPRIWLTAVCTLRRRYRQRSRPGRPLVSRDCSAEAWRGGVVAWGRAVRATGRALVCGAPPEGRGAVEPRFGLVVLGACTCCSARSWGRGRPAVDARAPVTRSMRAGPAARRSRPPPCRTSSCHTAAVAAVRAGKNTHAALDQTIAPTTTIYSAGHDPDRWHRIAVVVFN